MVLCTTRFYPKPQNRCPASFEVFDGACTQSPYEINLFLDRVVAFPDQSFTILSVHELHALGQEVIANFLAKHSRSKDKIHLHCIQLKDTILHAPPGVEIRSWDDSSLNDDKTCLTWLQNHVIGKKHVHKITTVVGSCGSGKTTYIRREMDKLASDKASLYIHEDFSLSKAVKSLTSKFSNKKSQNRSIHISFSISNVADEASQKVLLYAVNNFFNSFLLLGIVHDPSSGTCFHSGMHAYHLFVELDNAQNEETCRSWLRCHVPILTCCGNTLQPPLEYIIDDPTHRVCTYLRAYDDGTIDRKFNPRPRNKRIFFVLDYSGSMEIDLGGRNALEIATDCMVSIFDSHVQQMDVSLELTRCI